MALLKCHCYLKYTFNILNKNGKQIQHVRWKFNLIWSSSDVSPNIFFTQHHLAWDRKRIQHFFQRRAGWILDKMLESLSRVFTKWVCFFQTINCIKNGEKGIPLRLRFMQILKIQNCYACCKMFRWVSRKISKIENRDKSSWAIFSTLGNF